jgi:hypothetical protein
LSSFMHVDRDPDKGPADPSAQMATNRVCKRRPCFRTAFPWCSRTIHSTRVQPLQRHPVASVGRNSGIRHQSAVSRDHSSRIILLKPQLLPATVDASAGSHEGEPATCDTFNDGAFAEDHCCWILTSRQNATRIPTTESSDTAPQSFRLHSQRHHPLITVNGS